MTYTFTFHFAPKPTAEQLRRERDEKVAAARQRGDFRKAHKTRSHYDRLIKVHGY